MLLSVTDTVATVPQSLGDGAAGLATGLTIFGADAPDVIALGPGEDAVVVGGPDERLRGGGNDTFYVATATAAATIDGGHANSQIVVTGGGPVTLGSAITGIDTVRIVATRPTSLTLNAQPGVTAWASNAGDTLSAGGADQRLIAGLGSDVLVGSSAGGDVFAGRAAELASDTIENFTAGDAIDVTSVGIAGARFAEHVNDVPGLSTLFVLDGHDGMGVYVAGTIDPTLLHLADDGDHGVVLEQTPGLYTATSDAQIDHVLGLLADRCVQRGNPAIQHPVHRRLPAGRRHADAEGRSRARLPRPGGKPGDRRGRPHHRRQRMARLDGQFRQRGSSTTWR